MRTITIQIGNSDDKLTQIQWASYVSEVDSAIKKAHANIHFSGFSEPGKPWQNAAWVIEYMGDMSLWIVECGKLREKLTKIRKQYKQDSIAWTEGQTYFY